MAAKSRRRGKWLKRSMLSLLALIVIFSFFNAVNSRIQRANVLEEFPAPGELFDVGTHRLHMYCVGTGEPTVVLEAGTAWFSVLAWSPVMEKAEAITRVCAYDRSGLGYSDVGPRPRSMERMIDEFQALLAASAEPPPYVLVGHSLGGGLIWLYAQERPEEIAGLISVDGVPPGFGQLPQLEPMAWLERMLLYAERLGVFNMRPVGTRTLDPDDMPAEAATLFERSNFLSRAPWEEMVGLSDLSDRMDAVGAIGDIPVIQLVAGEEGQTRNGQVDAQGPLFWELQQAAAAELSTNGQVWPVPDSGHFIPFEDPDIVVEAIRSMVEQYRSTQ